MKQTVETIYNLKMKKYRPFLISLILVITFSILTSGSRVTYQEEEVILEHPLLFVLVTPPMGVRNTFGHQLETFGNHKTGINQAGWGGDLCLMDREGNVRLLTREAGFGVESGELQAENAIAVRQPTVHWDGNRALFSMVIGGPIKAFDQTYRSNKWQIYEITNLNEVVAGGEPEITKVANQPEYNNISPIYGSDDQIIFTSDAPLFEMEHTYPQKDEYESADINTGIFKLNTETGEVIHLTHSPSGDFDLHLASDGRIISTRWEHLKRDQQADAHRAGLVAYEPVNYDSEAEDALIIRGPAEKDGKPYADADGTPYEIFPEARVEEDPTRDPNEPLHDFNEFLPWEITENGERHQTLNHVGRHEFGGVYQNGSKLDDPNLVYNLGNFSANQIRGTVGSDAGIFQIKEDPRPGKEGTFYGTWSKEFSRLASGRIFEFALPIGADPQQMEVIDWTNTDIDRYENSKGHFRNPIMLQDGTMLVSFTPHSDLFSKEEVYHFQICKMTKLNVDQNNTEHVAAAPLTGAGFQKKIVYWGDSAEPLTFDVNLSEVDIVEIVPRNRPNARPTYEIATVEKQVLDEEGIDEEMLRQWMIENNLALIAIRNATERDQGEQQQPFNLRIPGGVSTIPASGKVYDISHFQIFQADLIRGYGLDNYVGRRVIATPLHNNLQNPNVADVNLLDADGPEGSVKISKDGSIAAFVPATRALTWQTVSPDLEPIVRERQWITFAPGEIRTCEGCHGINSKSHAGNSAPDNKPEALRELLRAWKSNLIVGVDDPSNLSGLTLHQNTPNPFKGQTIIQYDIPETSEVELKIYNSLGQEVVTLINEIQQKGNHRVTWNGVNAQGKKTRYGLYYCTLKTNKGSTIIKMLLNN